MRTSVGISVVMGCVVGLCALWAQSADIIAFQGNGSVVWTNSNTNLYYQIQWASALQGTNPWASSYGTLTDIRLSASVATNPVPMFYRIVGASNIASRVLRTGVSASYRTGDDGYHNAGIPFVAPRFTDLGDGTVMDNQTGLKWARDANIAGTNNSWNAAIDYCNGLVIAGHDDWRLPNVREMLSLIDYSPEDRLSPDFPGSPFVNVRDDPAYWTSTCGSTLFGKQSYYLFFTGSVVLGEWTNEYAGCVWPVRGGN